MFATTKLTVSNNEKNMPVCLFVCLNVRKITELDYIIEHFRFDFFLIVADKTATSINYGNFSFD